MFPRVTPPSATKCKSKLLHSVRLACVKRAASVRSEPGSNSQVKPFVPKRPPASYLSDASQIYMRLQNYAAYISSRFCSLLRSMIVSKLIYFPSYLVNQFFNFFHFFLLSFYLLPLKNPSVSLTIPSPFPSLNFWLILLLCFIFDRKQKPPPKLERAG